ncbi:MAG: hypothetical protein ACOX52_08830 [Verrucomicrobiota bacterium]
MKTYFAGQTAWSIDPDSDTDPDPDFLAHCLPRPRPRTRTRTPTRPRRITMCGNVYRFAVYKYVSGPNR